VQGQVARVAQLGRLRSTRDLIDRALSEPLDVRRRAAHAGYSRFHFIRAFRAAYGETPAQYLGRRRIERSQELLALANLTVREVGELVGFTSLAAFSGRFKARVTDDGFRWTTVHAADQPDVVLILGQIGPPMVAEEQAPKLRELVAMGAFGVGVLQTDDCVATYQELSANGVEFLQEPQGRPYGVEAVLRDDSGNWFALTEAAD
jgi:AraC-like DNA-binding protein